MHCNHFENGFAAERDRLASSGVTSGVTCGMSLMSEAFPSDSRFPHRMDCTVCDKPSLEFRAFFCDPVTATSVANVHTLHISWRVPRRRRAMMHSPSFES